MIHSPTAEVSTNEALLSITRDLKMFATTYEALRDSAFRPDVSDQRLKKWASFYNEIGNLNIQTDPMASVFIADNSQFDVYVKKLEAIAGNIVSSISNQKNQLPNYFSSLVAAHPSDAVQNMAGDSSTKSGVGHEANLATLTEADLDDPEVRGAIMFLKILAMALLLIGMCVQMSVRGQYDLTGDSVSYKWLCDTFGEGLANVFLGQFTDLAAVVGAPFIYDDIRNLLLGKKNTETSESAIEKLKAFSAIWIFIEIVFAFPYLSTFFYDLTGKSRRPVFSIEDIMIFSVPLIAWILYKNIFNLNGSISRE